MRPLFHPPLEHITIEAVLHALSDPVRVAIYAHIIASSCPQNCSNFLKVSQKAIPKSTLSRHFKALREAGLIQSERRGVEMHNISRCPELNNRFPGLIPAILNAYHVQMNGKTHAGNGAKRKPARRAK
jgi:DNA-binding transcriptional ArsR family regulator